MHDEAAHRGPVAADDADLAAFDRAPPQQVPGIEGIYALGSGPAAAFVAFYSGGRYFAGGIKELTPQHFQLTGVVGHYEMNGDTVIPRAAKTSCPRPKHAGTVKRRSDPDEVIVSDDEQTFVLSRLATDGEQPRDGYVLDWGCFDAAMNFTPHAWTTVSL